MPMYRRLAVAAVATAVTVSLAACGNDDEASSGHNGHQTSATPTSSVAGHNSADVQFATGMIPHHRQAVEMSELAETRASSPKVKALAKKIKKAQGPEITTMTGWLESWDEPVPSKSGGMDHSKHGMSGMMTDEDMEKLEKASGTSFDTMFLRMMIKHHQGAVSMAKTEKKTGSYGPAKKMADDIIKSQTREIHEMNKLLGK